MARSKNKLRFAIVFVAVLLLVHSVPGVKAAPAVATVRPDPPTLNLTLNQVGDVNIWIEDVTDLYGVEIHGHFDPSVLQVVDAYPGAPGVQLSPGTFPLPQAIIQNSADNGLGTLVYVVTQINPTASANGSGIMMRISFQGMAVTQDSPLVIDYLGLWDPIGGTIPSAFQNGLINIFAYRYYIPLLSRAN